MNISAVASILLVSSLLLVLVDLLLGATLFTPVALVLTVVGVAAWVTDLATAFAERMRK